MLLGGRVGGCCSAVLHAAAADPLQLFTYYLDGHQDSPSTGGDHDTDIVHLIDVSEDILCHKLDDKPLGLSLLLAILCKLSPYMISSLTSRYP